MNASVSDPASPRARRRWWLMIALIPMIVVGVVAAFQLATYAHKQRLLHDAHTMLDGTSLGDLSTSMPPGSGFSNGTILCMDNCLDLNVDAAATDAPVIATNLEAAGWSVDIPDCFTNPDRMGPPCLVKNKQGKAVAIVGFDGPTFYLHIY